MTSNLRQDRRNRMWYTVIVRESERREVDRKAQEREWERAVPREDARDSAPKRPKHGS